MTEPKKEPLNKIVESFRRLLPGEREHNRFQKAFRKTFPARPFRLSPRYQKTLERCSDLIALKREAEKIRDDPSASEKLRAKSEFILAMDYSGVTVKQVAEFWSVLQRLPKLKKSAGRPRGTTADVDRRAKAAMEALEKGDDPREAIGKVLDEQGIQTDRKNVTDHAMTVARRDLSIDAPSRKRGK